MENPSVPAVPALPFFVRKAQAFLGISDSSWYRIDPKFRPRPVQIPGLGRVYRTADLLAWVESLNTASTRRKRKLAAPVAPEPEHAEANEQT